MHVVYKLIALSVVFGLTVANTVARSDPGSFDELPYESPIENFDVYNDTNVDSSLLDLALGKSDPVAIAIGVMSQLAGLKTKALSIAVVAIKWLVSKSLILGIGAIAVFAFCKLTDKCNFALAPVYDYVPLEVRSYVTPERLEEAQDFLYKAIQKYADEKERTYAM